MSGKYKTEGKQDEQITDGIDIKSWTGEGGVSYSLNVEEGVLLSSREEVY
jgi:hypothetical protein